MSANLLKAAIDTIKALQVISAIEALVIIFLVGLFAVLLPLKEIVPIYVEFSSSGNNFVTIKTAKSSTEERALLRDISLRAYIVQRESVDQISEFERYDCVLSMSSSRVGEVFKKRYVLAPTKSDKKSPDYKLPLAKEDGFKRQIHVESDIPINQRGKSLKHQIDFYTIDTVDDDEPISKHWVALIEYRFTHRKISLEKLKKSSGVDGAVCNPLGIQVVDYTLAKKDHHQ